MHVGIHEEYADTVLRSAFHEAYQGANSSIASGPGRPRVPLDGLIRTRRRVIALQIEARNHNQIPLCAKDFATVDGEFDAKLFIVMKPNLNRSFVSAQNMARRCYEIISQGSKVPVASLAWRGDGRDRHEHFDHDVAAVRMAVAGLDAT